MKLIFVVIAAAALLSSCTSTKAKEDVDKKLSQIEVTATPNEIAYRGQEVIMSSPNLTDEQKAKITALMTETKAKNLELSEETNKLKLALFETLAEKEYKASEVNLIKKRLKKVESKKMDLMFSNLDKVKEVLGVKQKAQSDLELKRIYRDMF